MANDKTVLIINGTAEESRVALVENGNTAELYVERIKDRGMVGNIYKGRVARVLPGMQASFVDIGLDRAAFLYVGDVLADPATMASMMDKDDNDDDASDDTYGSEYDEESSSSGDRNQQASIEELLEEGQEILVQVIKDPIGTKGCRVSTHISLAGRHLVFMPNIDHVGVSRRIGDREERERLSQVLDRFKGEGGFIARTASEGTSVRKLRADMNLLVNLWKEIVINQDKARAPSTVHEEFDLSLRAARDLFTADVDRLVVDNVQTYERIMTFIDRFMPRLKSVIELYKGKEPIFDHFGIEMEINRALGRKVWLKSGGYIVIDQAEALTAIDVNTGRYVGQHNLEDTILKTNLEAIKEIVEQLRLRNIGGIVIIDFIDMERVANREKVVSSLREEVKKDKAKTHVSELTELGLVQMTRKRVRDSIGRLLCEPCFYCDGKGYLKSKTTICYEIFREIKRDYQQIKGSVIVINAHPEICDMLLDEEAPGVSRLERATGKKIMLRSLPYFHIEQYELLSKQPHHSQTPQASKGKEGN